MALCGCTPDGKCCEPRGALVIERCHMCVNKAADATCKIFRIPWNQWRDGLKTCREFLIIKKSTELIGPNSISMRSIDLSGPGLSDR